MTKSALQQAYRTYRPGPVIQALAWFLVIGSLVAIAGMFIAVWLDRTEIAKSDEWAAIGIGVFLSLLCFGGVGLLRTHFILGNDYVEIVRPFGTHRFAVSELGGFGLLIHMSHLVPTVYIRLYRDGPVEITRIATGAKYQAEVERWFRERLPVVVDDGSVARPRPRYRDG